MTNIKKYRVFNTQQEAIDAEAQVAANMGFPKPAVNAKTGKIYPDKLTIHWDEVRQIADGRWVFASPDEVGIDEDPGWWPEI